MNHFAGARRLVFKAVSYTHLHGVSARKVEQSMRYAIELAWKRGRIDEQYRIVRGTIDAQRGKPTCGEMIAQLADILRMEEV